MEFKIKNKRTILLIIAFAIVFYWGLNHLVPILELAEKMVGVFSPFILGGAIAFVLNVPLKLIEKVLGPHMKNKKMLLRIISILLSFALAVGIVLFVIVTVIPELINTLVALNAGIPKFLDDVSKWVTGLTATYPEITDYIASLEVNWTDLTHKALTVLQSSVTNVLSSTWGVATSVIGGITTTALGLIFSVYILAQKEKLGMQAKKIVYAYLPTKWVNRVLKVFHISNKTFSGFISGQCTEAVVFGCFCYLGMVLFRFPYALSISVLIGFLTLIPIVGAFLGTALGAILIMVTSPLRAVWFVVLIIVLQQIDGNLIYPRIVGNSVGLPGIWVMMAVTVGGSLMGILGMLVFVPLSSVLYALLRENVNIRLGKKDIKEEAL